MPFAKAETPNVIRADGLYVLTAAMTYTGSTRNAAKRQILTILAGFVTDLGSVPKLLRALMNVAGRGARPFILHDALCEAQRLAHADGRTPEINSIDTDGILRAALREVGVPRLERELYWIGVRWGALTSPYRRAGWWRTLPRLLALSLPLLPLLVIYVPGVLVVQGLLWAVGLLLDRWDPACPHRRAANMDRARALAERTYRDFLVVLRPGAIDDVSVGKLTTGIMTANLTISAQMLEHRPNLLDQVTAAHDSLASGRLVADPAVRHLPGAILPAAELHAPGAEDPNCVTCKQILCAAFPACPPDAPHMAEPVDDVR